MYFSTSTGEGLPGASSIIIMLLSSMAHSSWSDTEPVEIRESQDESELPLSSSRRTFFICVQQWDKAQAVCQRLTLIGKLRFG
jgi:hypothetical protein